MGGYYRMLLSLVLAGVLLPIVFGATLYGNIYDLSLGKVKGAIIEINTTPQQLMVSADGSYRITVAKGSYQMSASKREQGVVLEREVRNISVLQDGTYAVDFILFPLIEVEEEFNGPEVDSFEEQSSARIFWIALSAAIVLLAGIFAYVSLMKNRGKEEDAGKKDALQRREEIKENKPQEEEQDKDIGKVLSIIEKHGRRTTQKDLRKELPFSEAKISLLIAELEHKGKLEKIKKGRGNILVLK